MSRGVYHDRAASLSCPEYSFPRAALTHDHTAGLKTTEIHRLPDPEARKPKSRCRQGWSLPEVPREHPFRACVLNWGPLDSSRTSS